MGTRPLYYCALPRALVFASEIKCILAHPEVAARVDEDALADLMLDGYTDRSRTCFHNILSVPPGHAVVATSQTIETREHWDFDPHRSIRCRSLDEYAEAFRPVFDEAVRRRVRSAHPVAFSVSGGVDSSAIFAQAARSRSASGGGAALRGISLAGTAGSAADERRFVDSLEAECGGPIIRLPLSQIRLLEDGEAVVRHAEMPAVQWDARRALLTRARDLGCAVIVDGFFGDQMLFARSYLLDLAWRLRWTTVRRHLREFDVWMTDAGPGFFRREFGARVLRSTYFAFGAPGVRALRAARARRRTLSGSFEWFTPRFSRRVLERADARRAQPRRFSGRHAEQCYANATSGHYRTLLHNEIATGTMHGLEVVHPFRDRDLVAFLMAIPGEAVNAGGVPKGLLRRALGGTMPEAIRTRRWKADFTALNNDAVAEECGKIRQILAPGCQSARLGLVDAAAVRRDLEPLTARIGQADNAALGWRIARLAGLELWLREFGISGVA